MEQYKSHKIVEAGQIAAIHHGKLVLANGEEILVDDAWERTHQPQVGGYAVRYKDGYLSWSPAEAFESGYTHLGALELQLIDAVKEEPIMKFFAYKHLPPQLQAVSRKWCDLALDTLQHPKSAERSVALRKLLEGKDAAVRAALP